MMTYMKNYIRILTMITALMFGAVSETWALTADDVEIEIKPSGSGNISKSISEREVTLTVTPAAGYYIRTSDFIIEKLISPGNANAPKRRVGEITDVIKGKMYNSDMTKEISSVEAGSTAKYVFTIPDGYDGVYVTANFYLKTEGNIIRITSSTSLGDNPSMSAHYILVEDVSATVVEKLYNSSTTETPFTGIFEGEAQDDGSFPKITGLEHALFQTVDGGTVKNIVLDKVNIDIKTANANVGAIANEASGATRIYNCGILSGSVGGTKYVGGIVGFIKETARVINCYSYANVKGGTNAAGIVGYNNVATTANFSNTDTYLKTMVMNCMFYGNITGATAMKPVYGGKSISNAGATGVNGYNYYRNGKDVTFDDSYVNFDAYFCTLPADEEYLTRFEYYRSILNSNKKLCTWWINGTSGTAPTDADVEAVGIAKWVLDPEIAPYPILKKWGKYPSVINQDPEYVWNPETKKKVSRSIAEPYQGKKLGTISVTVNAGAKHAGTGITSTALSSAVVMDMDTLNHDYSYAKIQLPYYNELFGDPTADAATQWDKRYAGNYKDYVVTGWKITSISGGTPGTFKGYAASANGAVSSGAVSPDDTSGKPWEDGFNFADRNCTNKDLYSKSGRVFAQGGYYYVPEGVTSITIEAYWGKAVYLHNKEHSVDRVNVASGGDGAATAEYGTAFSPAGTLSETFLGQTVQTTLQEAISALTLTGTSYTVYDQAIVLVGNVQVKNRSESVGRDKTASNSRPFTIMSIDEDMDNEPDYCLEFQFRQKTDRPGIHPVRFDFLPVPELGLALRTNQNAYAIGIFIPQGHFEITETSFMHTTQFEYDGDVGRVESPIILNGGHFEQIVVRYGPKNKVNYFLLGGHFRMKRFTPGYHASNVTGGNIRHCVVNAIGGDYPEFYLSGIYRPELAVNADNPHCYINGGRFGTLAGAGYEQVDGNVTFKIDHALIDYFYGGGLNGAKPVTGGIDVTINNSIVYGIYCGGPKVGEMTKTNGVRKTVKTTADNTIFNKYFGGGNGGTSYYREQKFDNDVAWPNSESGWTGATYYFSSFDPLNFSDSKNYNTNKGYHDLFEFEIFNSSNGLNANAVIRTIYVWAQFGTTITGTVTNILDNCTIKGNFYGGGSLGNVDGDVISTLNNTHVTGSVFGGGYSAEIPQFRVHDKSNVHVPTRNKAGLIDKQGYLDYVQDNGKDRYYRWTNDDNGGSATTDAPTYWSETDKEYKCYTPISLAGLGEVSGNVILTINGSTTTVGESVYGGGEESGVGGNTTVTVNSGTIGKQGDGGVEYGNVYGGGKGKVGERDAGYVKGNTVVNISQAEGKTTTIYHNVYGGGAYGSVGDFNYDANNIPISLKTENTGATNVTITGGTFGWNGSENGMVFGSSRGDVATPEGDPAIDPNDRMAWVYSTQVNIGTENATTGPHIKGSVYGSGENGHTLQNTVLNINSGTIGVPTGEPITDDNDTPEDTSDDTQYSGAAYPYRGNVYGGGCGTDKYDSDGDDIKDAYNPLAGIVKGTATVNITGGHVVHNVYGAGAMGSVGGGVDATSGKTTINISGGRIGYDGVGNGHIFGAARGDYGVSTAASGLANVRETEVNIIYKTTPTADNEGKTEKLITGSVFGGGEAGTVKGNVAVKMTGGLVLNDVYGGGALADTQTSNWDASLNENKGDWATGKTSASTQTTVRLTGGTILGEAYGGGLGETDKPAYVYGNVLLDLNGTTSSGETGTSIAEEARGCVVDKVFGCNNAAGSPKGTVTVHVYATQNKDKSQIANTDGETPVVDAKRKSYYDVSSVYGGGNMAAYEPAGGKTTTNFTNVIIDGCGLSSIQQVYGGGNAASTPATKVTINGTYEIDEVFGGGNGKDAIIVNNEPKPNPGANVGFYEYKDNASDAQTPADRSTNYGYGSGKASVNIFGGTIHRVFGGSNTKGNVRQTAVTMLDENSGCDFCVDEAYGGGKSAPMDAEAKLLMACIPGLKAAYGGAEAAAIQGNVTLNITNGTFDRVFGGNNKSGTINGAITVNIEEVGCKPVIIGELYGGGNLAGYSVYGYDSNDKPIESGSDALYDDPQVNVKSFTSIGKVFGGGYGSGATMVGNPTVSVNEVYGRYYNQDVSVVGENAETPNHYPIPSHEKGKMGAISEVFGGGNAAKVIGNTTVNIATLSEVFIVKQVSVGGDVSSLYILNNNGTYDPASGTAVEGTTYYEKKDVLGADIRGNVYGGGNNAEVTGNANVNIGKRVE